MQKVKHLEAEVMRLASSRDPRDIQCLQRAALDWRFDRKSRTLALATIRSIGNIYPKPSLKALRSISAKADDWAKSMANTLAENLERQKNGDFKGMMPAVEEPAT